MKPVITNCFAELEHDEEDFICKCSICGKESEDEEDFDTCENCGNYFCPEHEVTREHQGYNEIFCSKKCKKDYV